MNKPPAFQFYADDFLGGTIHFTDAEVGLYVRLLCVQWSAGGIEDNDDEIASIGKGGTRIDRVKAKFKKCDDGLLRNPRLEEERSKQEAYRLSRSNNGKHGGRPCKPHENHMVLKTKAQESSPSPTPVSSLHREGEPTREEATPELPTEDQAIASTMAVGIPEPFTRYVFQDWASRQGKDAGGVLVSFLPYVTKRWQRERVEWESGTHKGKKANTNGHASHSLLPRLSEIQDYTRQKWGDDPRHPNWSSSFYRHWSDPKREWKRQGRLIDWKIELTEQVARWRQ